MSSGTVEESSGPNVEARGSELFQRQWHARLAKVDRLFAWLLAGQWVFAILMAIYFSPYGWAGKVKVIHTHVYIAVFMGGAIALFPILLAIYRPGSRLTRHVIAI
jgi:hypothetical protein